MEAKYLTRQEAPAYLRTKQVLARYNISRTTLWRWVKAGEFPAPVKLAKGSTLTFWKVSDLEARDARGDAS